MTRCWVAVIGLGIAGLSAAWTLATEAGDSAAVTLYLAYLGVTGNSTGLLLWPAVALHVILTTLLIRASCITCRTTNSSPT